MAGVFVGRDWSLTRLLALQNISALIMRKVYAFHFYALFVWVCARVCVCVSFYPTASLALIIPVCVSVFVILIGFH